MEKLEKTYERSQAAMMGTRLHEFCSECITLGIFLPNEPKTINLYVNDALDLGMEPEVTLYYSEHAFGTADAISFKNDFLRIHDLKTGVSRSSMKQLEVYAALFCLEYDIDESAIDMELRIYQSDEVLCHTPEVKDIGFIINKIVSFDKRLDEIKIGG